MIDPEAFADYEEWKLDKLAGGADLSVQRYNAEREAKALAWDAGWFARDSGKPQTDNFYRIGERGSSE